MSKINTIKWIDRALDAALNRDYKKYVKGKMRREKIKAERSK